MVRFLIAAYGLGIRKACKLIGLCRNSYKYKSRATDRTLLSMRLRDLAAARPRYGYRRLHVLLRREGHAVNHKLVHRLYVAQGLELRLKKRKKRLREVRVLGPKATAPHERWSMDFMADGLEDGRRFRVLTIVDHFSRVSPCLVVAQSLTGRKVVEALEGLPKPLPKAIHVDNGPEFVSRALDAWAYRNRVKLEFSRPGKPTDNAPVESFNARLRAECLSCHVFETLAEAQIILDLWRHDYNETRPHSALGYLTPAQFLERSQDKKKERATN
jgi:putative transposase